MTAAAIALTQQALLVAKKELDARPDDDWAPSVQGAVSRVIGLRSLSNGLVMKLFTADGARSQSERERRALPLVGDYADVPVPQLVSYGEIPAPGHVWIGTDRPTGWLNSVRQLDAHLHCVSRGA